MGDAVLALLILSQAQYTGYFAIEKDSGREAQSINQMLTTRGVCSLWMT